MGRRSGVAVAVFALSACGAEGPAPIETSADLHEALAEANSGDTIRAAEGTFGGPFTVPSGVRLCGAGRGLTILTAGEGENVITVAEGDAETTICDLTVEVGIKTFPDDNLATPENESADERVEIGVWASNARATLLRIDFDLAYGVGVAAQGADGLVITDVRIAGHVTPRNRARWPSPATPWSSPANGVIVQESTGVVIERLDVSGTAVRAVELSDDETSWAGGDLRTNLGTSIFIWGGTATIEAVSVSDILAGFQQLESPYGLLIVNRATVSTADVSISGDGAEEYGSSVGVLQDGATSTHTHLSVTDNGSYGVIVENGDGTLDRPSFSLTGASEIRRNSGFGLGALESTGIVLDDVDIGDTAAIRRIVGDLTYVELGVGLTLVRCDDCPDLPSDCHFGEIRLSNIRIAGDEVIGLVVDGSGGSVSGVEVQNIQVSGSPFGAGLENTNDVPVGWATEIHTDAPAPTDPFDSLGDCP